MFGKTQQDRTTTVASGNNVIFYIREKQTAFIKFPKRFDFNIYLLTPAVLTCAAVIYKFKDVNGNITAIVLQHATGDYHCPIETNNVYNLGGYIQNTEIVIGYGSMSNLEKEKNMAQGLLLPAGIADNNSTVIGLIYFGLPAPRLPTFGVNCNAEHGSFKFTNTAEVINLPMRRFTEKPMFYDINMILKEESPCFSEASPLLIRDSVAKEPKLKSSSSWCNRCTIL